MLLRETADLGLSGHEEGGVDGQLRRVEGLAKAVEGRHRCAQRVDRLGRATVDERDRAGRGTAKGLPDGARRRTLLDRRTGDADPIRVAGPHRGAKGEPGGALRVLCGQARASMDLA